MATAGTITEIMDELERALRRIRETFRQGEYEDLALAARDALSAASRLHQRGAVMAAAKAEGLLG